MQTLPLTPNQICLDAESGVGNEDLCTRCTSLPSGEEGTNLYLATSFDGCAQHRARWCVVLAGRAPRDAYMPSQVIKGPKCPRIRTEALLWPYRFDWKGNY